jgi:hypothetical protein
MSNVEMRLRINHMLGGVEDEKFLRSILSILETYSEECTGLTQQQMEELDRRIQSRNEDGSPGQPWRESLKTIRDRISS